MSGKLVSPTGETLGGARIEASVEPSAQQMIDLPAGAEIFTVPIGSAVTSSSGTFKLKVTNVKPLKQASDDESLVSVVLTAETPEGQLFYRVRLALTGSNQLRAYQPDVQSDLNAPVASHSRITRTGSNHTPVVTLVTSQVTPNQAPNRVTAAGVGAAKAPVDPPRTDRPVYNPPAPAQRVKYAGLSMKAAAASGSYDPDVWCGGNHWYRKKSKDIVGRNVALMDQATGSKTTGTFSFETTKGTSLEIGVTNRAGKLAATVGMSKGTETTASVEAPIGKNTKAEWYVGYDFNIYDVMCSNDAGLKWWSGYSEYRAKKFDGNSSRRLWTPFTCKRANEASVGPGYTVTISKNKTATKSAAFGLGDGSLKASQSWGSTQTVQFHAATRNTSYSLCGNTGKYVDGVSKVRQT